MINLSIFASGAGTNAENIIKYFDSDNEIKIKSVFCNRPDAYVIKRAEKLGIPVHMFDTKEPDWEKNVLKILKSESVDYLILAGFLKRIPPLIIEAFPERILNIHPALLPAYGGKGMYGERVHKAVIEAGESISGISIHLINEEYDRGNVIFRAQCGITPEDTPETLANKIHDLEKRHFPEQIKNYIESKR